ncbi:hypothetical protein RirG_011410 [Rhizophagus irregularis DAOM 197198w]|uniref:Uncharacterized protein n=1 Tax=Rhizophagus irregularis (strain DAOM 197198w) TaxID=1432141 RepID=A0A015KAM7_RHIIW|nr:hypothetical protein RirG_011410 [Rhizophagus irregularis DAOM 197198w]
MPHRDRLRNDRQGCCEGTRHGAIDRCKEDQQRSIQAGRKSPACHGRRGPEARADRAFDDPARLLQRLPGRLLSR